jgi:hypothetical protein
MCKKLWEIQFPQLEYIFLGELFARSQELATFILAHNNTLKSIHLSHRINQHMFGGQAQTSIAGTKNIVGKSLLNSSSLPVLRSFSGSIPIFLHMVNARMKRLERLRRIRLRHSGPRREVAIQIRQLLDTLLPDEHPLIGFSLVRELGIGLAYYPTDTDAIDFYTKAIEDCSKIFGPSIEVWWDRLGSPMEVERLGPLFGAFPKLRVVHLYTSVVGEGIHLPDSTALVLMGEYSVKLAVWCRLLEEVHFRVEYRNISVLKRIGRNEDGPYLIKS